MTRSRAVETSDLSARAIQARLFYREALHLPKTDPWYAKALYDAGQDLYSVGDFTLAANAFEQASHQKSEYFPKLRFQALDQKALCLASMNANGPKAEAAIREAISAVDRTDAIGRVAEMGLRLDLAAAVSESKRADRFDLAIKEWKALVSLGKQGRFDPSPELRLKISDLSKTSWAESAETALRNLAFAAAEARHVDAVRRMADLSSDPGSKVAFAALLERAKVGNLGVSTYRKLLSDFPEPSPARATILADALEAALSANKCDDAITWAQQLLRMAPVPSSQEDPADHKGFAEEVLRACSDSTAPNVHPTGTKPAQDLLMPGPGAAIPGATLVFSGLVAGVAIAITIPIWSALRRKR